MEARDAKTKQYRAISDMTQLEKEKVNKEYESQYFKNKAAEIERQKNLELAIRDDIHTRE